MVGVDAPDDRRDLRLGVVVGVDRVVHEAGADGAVAQRALVADALVGAPLGARVDGGLRDGLRGPGAGAGRLQRDAGAAALERALLGVLLLVGGGARRVGPGGVRLVVRRLGLAPLRRARVDEGEGQVVGQRGALGARLHLHVVDLADEHRLGARSRGGGLGAARVGTVLVVVLQVLPGAPLVTDAGPHAQADLVVVEVLAVLPGHADGGEAGDGLRLAHHAGVGGPAGNRTPLEAGEPAGGLRQRHLGHVGGDGSGRHGGRGQLGGGQPTAGGAAGRAVVTDDVERDHAGGGGQHDEHDAEREDLLAERDETSLERAHEKNLFLCGGRSHKAEVHTSHTSHGRGSE
ncbi:hypothetical protein NOZE110980_19715 [Nocardioides zeicaulis]